MRVKKLALKPAAVFFFLKKQVQKIHNPENWVIRTPSKTNSVAQKLFELLQTPCYLLLNFGHIFSSQNFTLDLDSTEELSLPSSFTYQYIQGRISAILHPTDFL